MTGLRISDDLTLPLDVAGETIAILAKRGAGKTNTATVLVEELVAANVQTVIVDPVGAWWGIRSSADGGKGGLPVHILGGQHGDVPLEKTAGSLIADVVVDSGQSMLLDLSDFPSKASTERFVADFADRLFRRKGRASSLLHLVLEEADEFAPQTPRGGYKGDMGRMAGAVEQIVRRGRSRGLGVTLITQRSAVLNKDVLTQADVLVVMRTTGPHDVAAVKQWVAAKGDEHGNEVIASLPGLETGEAWIWNPERDPLPRRSKVRARRTFDSSATPKAGETKAEPSVMAPIDLTVLGKQIEDTVERAKANDPAELRKRIRDLESDMSVRPAEVETVVETVTEVVEVPVLSEGDRALLARVLDTSDAAIEDLRRQLARIADVLERPRAEQDERKEPSRPITSRRDAASRTPARRPAPPTADSNIALGGGERKILDSLASHYPMRVTRAQLGTLSGYSHKGGTFTKYFGILKKAGLLLDQAGEISVSEQGLEYLGGSAPAPKTPDELLEMWRGALEGGPRKLLDELASVFPSSLTRQELGERTDYEATGGTFTKYLGILRRNELVTVAGGEVRASETLFIGAHA